MDAEFNDSIKYLIATSLVHWVYHTMGKLEARNCYIVFVQL